MTLSYELCKRLKECGFPDMSSAEMETNGREYISDGEQWLKVPTLSELIEACGRKFGGIYQVQGKDLRMKDTVHWYAYSYGKKIEIEGKTPEEAVANLYLKINKN